MRGRSGIPAGICRLCALALALSACAAHSLCAAVKEETEGVAMSVAETRPDGTGGPLARLLGDGGGLVACPYATDFAACAVARENLLDCRTLLDAPGHIATRMSVGYDFDSLMVVVDCRESEEEKLALRVEKPPELIDDEDRVELYLDAGNSCIRYFRIVVTASGRTHEEEDHNPGWQARWEGRAEMTPDGWRATFRIPFESLRSGRFKYHRWGASRHFDDVLQYGAPLPAHRMGIAVGRFRFVSGAEERFTSGYASDHPKNVLRCYHQDDRDIEFLEPPEDVESALAVSIVRPSGAGRRAADPHDRFYRAYRQLTMAVRKWGPATDADHARAVVAGANVMKRISSGSTELAWAADGLYWAGRWQAALPACAESGIDDLTQYIRQYPAGAFTDEAALLLKRHGTDVTPLLVERLQDKDPSVRQRAAEALGEIHFRGGTGARAVTAKLAKVLGGDSEAMVRATAALSLSKIRDGGSGEALIRAALEDKSADVRREAGFAMQELVCRSRPTNDQHVEGVPEDLVAKIIRLIPRMLEDPSSEVRFEYLTLPAFHGDEPHPAALENVPLLIDLYRKEMARWHDYHTDPAAPFPDRSGDYAGGGDEWDFPARVLEIIGDARDPRALGVLLEAADSPNPWIRYKAYQSLDDMRYAFPADERIYARCVAAARTDPCWRPRYKAAFAISRLGHAGAEAELVGVLERDRSWFVRMVAVSAFRKLEWEGSVEPLLLALQNDTSERVRAAAAPALANQRVAVERLEKALAGQGERAAVAIVEAIAAQKTDAVRAALERIEADGNLPAQSRWRARKLLEESRRD